MGKIITGLLVAGVLVGTLLRLLVFRIQGPPVQQGETDLSFSQVEFPYVHQGDRDRSLPFMALSVVDLDGDGVDEVFIGGGHGQPDGLMRFQGTRFEPHPAAMSLTKKTDDATMGAASVDANGDGLEDLFVARESGVYLYESSGQEFAGRKLAFGLDPKTVPLSIALGDINRDGAVDLYVSGYIRLEHAEGETNFDYDYGGYSYLLLNRGDNTWEDISRRAGIWRQHNTFVAAFVDLDNDRWSDLVVAQDTGVVETWRNRGDLTFERKPNPTINSYPMGLGAGDIDNDGWIDLYFSNVGTTLPEALVRGNLPKDTALNMSYMLLRNQGDFTFEDVAHERQAALYGFGWGTSIVDLNNDGRMDLYFSQNYARFPAAEYLKLYPGRLLEQQASGEFVAVETVAGLTNENFGVTQVFSDFNSDGWLDVVLANLQGPARAFLNDGGTATSLQVRLPSEPIWLNSRVHVTLPNGERRTRQLVASTGLGSDSSDVVHVGLGWQEHVPLVRVERPDGHTVEFDNVLPGSVLTAPPAPILAMEVPAEPLTKGEGESTGLLPRNVRAEPAISFFQ